MLGVISGWGQPGWEQPTPATSPVLFSSHALSNPGKAAAGSRAGKLLKNNQSNNSRRVLTSGTGKNQTIQSSPNELHYTIFFFFLTHLLALGKPAGGGCGTGRVLVGLVMPQRHRASLSLAHWRSPAAPWAGPPVMPI